MLSVFLATYHTPLPQMTLILLKKIYKVHGNCITEQPAKEGTTPLVSVCLLPPSRLTRSAQNKAHVSEAVEGAGAFFCQDPF